MNKYSIKKKMDNDPLKSALFKLDMNQTPCFYEWRELVAEVINLKKRIDELEKEKENQYI